MLRATGQGQGPRARADHHGPPAVEPLEPRLLLDGGQVSGLIWNDLNGNGVQDAGEAALDGWQVELINAATSDVLTASTDESGVYLFDDVPAGTYELQCLVQAGWSQTFPGLSYSGSFSQLDTLFHPSVLNFDFAGALLPTADTVLTVTAIGDLDGSDEYLYIEAEGVVLGSLFVTDGMLSLPVTGELPISQATLAALAADGTVSVKISPSFKVSNLAGPESITVELSYPASGRRPVRVTDGGAVGDVSFGVFELAEIRGAKYNDLDRDGARDEGEPGVAGWTIELVDGVTGQLLATTVTDEAGDYAFGQLGPGTYRVRAPQRVGWHDTAPASGVIAVSPASGQIHDGADFGSFRLAEIGGQVWEDINGDGAQAAGDGGIDGRTVRLVDVATDQVVAEAVTASIDADLDGEIDPLTERGLYSFAAVWPGEYEVRLAPLANWTPSSPAGGAHSLVMASGDIASGVDFGCRADAGEIAGALWQDVDGDGVRDAEDTNVDGMTIELVDAATGVVVASAETGPFDANGDGSIDPLTEHGLYRFTGVHYGSYEVRCAVPQQWSQTSPAFNYAASHSETETLYSPNVVRAGFTGALPPTGNASLTIAALADLDAAGEYLTVEVEGISFGNIFVADGLQFLPVQKTLTIPRAMLASLAADGTVSVTIRPSAQVNNLGGTETITVSLSYACTGRHAITLAPGQSVGGQDFGLAPPFLNSIPTLTSVAPLTGPAEDQPFAITYAALLAASDAADKNGDTLTFRVESVAGGVLTKAGQPVVPGATFLAAGEALTWQPPANANGTIAAFAVKAFDGEGFSALAVQVSVVVQAVNDPPTLTSVQKLMGATIDQPFTITYAALAAAANAADVDGDALSFRVESPARGVLTKAGQAVVPGATLLGPGEQLLWEPDAGGTLEAFDVVAWDGQAASSPPVALRVEVAGQNQPPVLSAVQPLTGAAEDTPFTITYAALAAAADESDADSAAVAFRVESVAAGLLTKAGQPVVAGATLLGPGETLTWQPPANANGAVVAFGVRAWDGQAASAQAAAVTVQVAPVNDAPDARDDEAATDEDIPIATLNVLANDTDIDGDALAVSSFTQPAGGSVFYHTGPGGMGFTYTPAAGFHGSDSFTYTATDGQGGSDIATVRITVLAVNDDPQPGDDEAVTYEGQAVLIPGVLANDIDSDGDELTIASFTQPGAGTAVRSDGPAGPGFLYTPAAGFNGLDSFTYTVDDGHGGTAAATVRVTVIAVESAPVAADDQAATDEDTPVVTGNVLANDTDADGDELTIVAFTQPAHGDATDNGDGTFTYTPAPDFHGPDSFTYTITDGHETPVTATVWVTVAPVNDEPVAEDDSAATDEDAPVVTGNVLANDSDSDGDALNILSFTQPAHGSAVYNGDGTFTYAPADNFHGPDSFTYTAGDGQGGQATATVWLTIAAVNDDPAAADDSAATDEDAPVVTGDVLANDADADGDELSILSFTQPAHGSAVYNGDGTFTYTPAENFNGPDSFTYTIGDTDGGRGTGTVAITVAPVNDAPVAGDDVAAVPEGQMLTIAGVLDDDIDADGDLLRVVDFTQPDHGVVDLDGDPTDPRFVYTPAAGFFGTDSFTYTISDGQGGEASAVVWVMVLRVGSAPQARDDEAATDEDTPVTIGGALDNDTDGNGDPLRLESFTQPAHGLVECAGDPAEPVFTYTPSANFHGQDSFTYTVTDDLDGQSLATVWITVAPVNDAPVADDDSEATDEDTPVVTANVLANDTDGDGDELTIAGFTQPVSGAVSYNGDGTFTYTPAADFHGTDSFTYTLDDDDGGQAVATVVITVASVNDEPVAGDDEAPTDEDTPVVTGDVLANDSDADGDELTIATFTQPASGAVTYNGDGTFTYTPAADFHGTDSFTYTLDDDAGGQATATIVITVAPVNDAPVAADDSEATDEDTPLVTANVLANDTDGDGDELTVASFTQPANGAVTYNGDGTFTYSPAANFHGQDSFTYTVDDGAGSQAVATVMIAVAPVNDAPVAEPQAGVVPAGAAVEIALAGHDLETAETDLVFTIEVPPAHGVITLSDNLVTYTPDEGYAGPDSFFFTVADQGDGASPPLVSQPAAVELTVEEPFVLVALAGRVTRVVYVDADGTKVWVSLAGGGSAEARFDGDDIRQKVVGRTVTVSGADLVLEGLTVTGTRAASSLTITTDRRGNGRADVGGIAVLGPMRRIYARTTDLTGDLWVEGALRTLTLADVLGDLRIDLNAAGGELGRYDRATITLGRVSECTLDTHGEPIYSLTATDWLDADGGDAIVAPSMRRMRINGSRATRTTAAVEGDFQASIALSGEDLKGSKSTALAYARIAGSVTGGDWQIAGPVGGVYIDGEVSDWRLNVDDAPADGGPAGKLAVLSLGNVHSANVRIADALASARALRWADGRLEADSIKLLKITGLRKRGQPEILGDFGADLVVHGANVPERGSALQAVRIDHDLTGSTWWIGGETGPVRVNHLAVGSTVRSAGGIARIYLGGTVDSDFLAGVADSGSDHATSPADFQDPEATIGSIRIRGWRVGRGEPIPRFVLDSQFSAPRIGTVSLLNVLGGGMGCGLFVRANGGGEIRWLQYRDTLTRESWTWRPGDPLPNLASLTLQMI